MVAARIVERVQFTRGRVRRDGPYPVVEGVLLCGATSANRRRYRREAFAGGRVAKYNGRPVYLDHGSGRESRRYADKIGCIENARLRQDGMPVGDIAVNTGHPLAGAFLFDAEHQPRACGMSHIARCELVTSADGWEEITEVVSVESVDIVTDPATTRSLFESTNKRVKTMTCRQFYEALIRGAKSTHQADDARRWLREAEAAGRADSPLGTMDDTSAAGLGLDSPDFSDVKATLGEAFTQAILQVALKVVRGDLDKDAGLKKIGELFDGHDDLTDDDTAESRQIPTTAAEFAAATLSRAGSFPDLHERIGRITGRRPTPKTFAELRQRLGR